jgi:hypothetical protein
MFSTSKSLTSSAANRPIKYPPFISPLTPRPPEFDTALVTQLRQLSSDDPLLQHYCAHIAGDTTTNTKHLLDGQRALRELQSVHLIGEKVLQQCDKVLADIDTKIKSETNVLNDID